jgi:hypothetical protein
MARADHQPLRIWIKKRKFFSISVYDPGLLDRSLPERDWGEGGRESEKEKERGGRENKGAAGEEVGWEGRGKENQRKGAEGMGRWKGMEADTKKANWQNELKWRKGREGKTTVQRAGENVERR